MDETAINALQMNIMYSVTSISCIECQMDNNINIQPKNNDIVKDKMDNIMFVSVMPRCSRKPNQYLY